MMPPPPVPIQRCPNCGSEFPLNLLACPGCQRLVHGEQLRAIVEQAKAAEAAGRISEALAGWRSTLELLPPESTQSQRILAQIEGLSRQVERGGSTVPMRAGPVTVGNRTGAPAADSSPVMRRERKGLLGQLGAGLGLIGVMLWKFGGVLLVFLSKAKFLLLGLGKAKTFFSMLLYFGVYWTAFGWPFALGLVLSIYIHEMGHVAALVRYGIPATAPMFIPGIGALIRLNQHPATAREDARVGLAGPLWGLGAAVLAAALWFFTELPIFAAIAHVGAWINLFNLVPVWQLDGSRAFASLARWQRLLTAAGFGLAFWATAQAGRHEGLLILLALVAGGRALFTKAPKEADHGALLEFLFLIAALTGLLMIPEIGLQR